MLTKYNKSIIWLTENLSTLGTKMWQVASAMSSAHVPRIAATLHHCSSCLHCSSRRPHGESSWPRFTASPRRCHRPGRSARLPRRGPLWRSTTPQGQPLSEEVPEFPSLAWWPDASAPDRSLFSPAGLGVSFISLFIPARNEVPQLFLQSLPTQICLKATLELGLNPFSLAPKKHAPQFNPFSFQ